MARYEKGAALASGGHGSIYKCRDTRDNSNCVMKVIPYASKDMGVPSPVIREISVLKELSHRNVVRLLDEYDDAEGFHLIFELMELDLDTLIHGPRKTELNPAMVKGFLYQMLQAVDYCHSLKVMHRDLKPRNFLVDTKSNIIKLADFGDSRTFDVPLPQYSTKVVNHSYKAPELLLGTPYSRAVDIWSLGCIFAEMVERYVLFGGTSDAVVMSKITSVLGKPDEKDWPGVTAAIVKLHGASGQNFIPNLTPSLEANVPNLDSIGVDLLSKMLCMNPRERITAYDALEHRYFR